MEVYAYFVWQDPAFGADAVAVPSLQKARMPRACTDVTGLPRGGSRLRLDRGLK